MAGMIKINTERCKGCLLCLDACPKSCIVVSREPNESGFFPVLANNTGCTGCTMCAIICPEAIIEVFRGQENEIRIVEVPAKDRSAQKKRLAGTAKLK